MCVTVDRERFSRVLGTSRKWDCVLRLGSLLVGFGLCDVAFFFATFGLGPCENIFRRNMETYNLLMQVEKFD